MSLQQRAETLDIMKAIKHKLQTLEFQTLNPPVGLTLMSKLCSVVEEKQVVKSDDDCFLFVRQFHSSQILGLEQPGTSGGGMVGI